MYDILSHKHLVGNAYHFVFAVAIEDNDIVNIRTVAHKLVFFECRAEKTVITIDI